jgi:hypothetical protein
MKIYQLAMIFPKVVSFRVSIENQQLEIFVLLPGSRSGLVVSRSMSCHELVPSPHDRESRATPMWNGDLEGSQLRVKNISLISSSNFFNRLSPSIFAHIASCHDLSHGRDISSQYLDSGNQQMQFCLSFPVSRSIFARIPLVSLHWLFPSPNWFNIS